jgi:transketolase
VVVGIARIHRLDFELTSSSTIQDMTTTTTATATRRGYGYDDLRALMALQTGDEKHGPAATSTLDVLWVLYDRVLRIDPDAPDDPDRDRFLLSKGHGPMAYYAVLAAKGFFDVALLRGYGSFGSPLGMHPDHNLVPGVEISSGSLGHGLPIAVGRALALRAQGRTDPRLFVLVGDAELDEGSNNEAIVAAGRLGLDRLTAIVVDNSSSTHGWPGGIAERFAVEGWVATSVYGRDHDAIEQALVLPHEGAPHVVVAIVEEKDGT